MAFSPDGKFVLTGSTDKTARLWNATDGTQVSKFICRGAKVQSSAFLGAQLFVTGGSDNVIRVWDLNKQTEQFQIFGHTGSVAALAFDAQSATLVSGSFDTTVRIWQLRSADDLRDTARTPGDPVR